MDDASRSSVTVAWSCQKVPLQVTLRLRKLNCDDSTRRKPRMPLPAMLMGSCERPVDVMEMTVLTRFSVLNASDRMVGLLKEKRMPRTVAPPLPTSVNASKSMRDFIVAVRWEANTSGETSAGSAEGVMTEKVLFRIEKSEPFDTVKAGNCAPIALHRGQAM